MSETLFNRLFVPTLAPSEARLLLKLFREQERRDSWHSGSEEIASLHFSVSSKLHVLSRSKPTYCGKGHVLPEDGELYVGGRLRKDACKTCQLEQFRKQNSKRNKYRRDWKRRRKAEGTMARGT